MAPTRKSRSVKRVSYVTDVAPNKDGENNKRSGPRKKKLSDMLGPQWSKEELERFYEAYRRYGKDWKKVAVAVRNRSAEMVEALYTMNRAYLSLPEGTASVIGLIAMMTDHYCVLGGTDSEQESNEKSGALQKPLKQNRGKLRAQSSKGLDLPLPYLLQFQSGSSKYGCLSLLKKRRSGSRPHAVGKRTPRVPISYTCDKSKSFLSPLSQGLKRKLDAVDDDVAHEVALALTEASQKGGSPQISQTLNRKAETPSPAPTNDRMCAESEITSSKFHTGERDEYGHEISLGSTEADNGDQSRSKNYLMNMRHTGVMEAPSKRRRYNRKKLLGVEDSVDDHLEETKEACSGTEGQTFDLRGSLEVEITDATTSRNSTKGRKRSTKVLFKGGEETSFDALQTLADLSLMMPESAADTESSTQLKEEESQVVQKPRVKGISSIPGVKVTALKSSKGAKCFGPDGSETHQTREKSHQDESGMQKKRQKSSLSKVLKDDINVDSSLGGLPKIELQNRGKLPDDAARLKQAKLRRPLEHTSSSTDLGKEAGDSVPPTSKVPSMNQVILPTRIRSKRKMVKNKLVTEKNFRLANDLFNGKSDVTNSLSHGRSLNIKDKLSNFLSQYQARRWCTCEWFYSAIDYPWFAKREFVEYLDHVGLGHIPRLTRVEWGVIRSSLGKPRRFSDQFLKEEKEKLNQYRESVRTHYAELRAGAREGLPTDLARPLSVGQRVIAIHPKNGEVQNGSVLNIDHSRYRIQFDGPELGVEFVMDIDCMPLNFLESMPASFGRQNSAFSKFVENFNELKMNVQHKESRIEEHAKLSLYENATSPTHISPSTFPISNMVQHVKIDSSPDLQPKVGPSETAYTQQMLNSQPSTLSQNQARGADIQALSDLTRALDKKEALVSELRSMNDEVMENQRGGHKSLKDSDSFKKQYAAVLLQLNDVNEQVSAALLSLRQRNTYHGSQSHMWLKTMPNSSERGGHLSPFDHSTYQSIESKSNVSEIVQSSRVKARGIVDAAVQAMTSVKKEDKSRDTIEEAIDFINNRLSVDDLNVSALRPQVRKDLVDCTLALHDQTVACTSNLAATSDASDFKLDVSDQNGSQVPSDLIAHCVATLLIIQKCTERQFPPGDVAQVLDSAVTNMQPICSQNLPVYAEIQKCMGIIRNQILALVPT